MARRLRYYGSGDHATYWQVDDATSILGAFEGSFLPDNATDVIELYNAHRFYEAGFVATTASQEERAALSDKSARARSAVARYFTQVDAASAADQLQAIPHEYHQDALALLDKNRAFERCSAELMISVLSATGVRLHTMLSSKGFVKSYDAHLRKILLDDEKNAELLIRHYFSKDRRNEHYLPASLSTSDSRELMQRYMRSEVANSNYLRLIETAPISEKTGVTARLKLEAKRRRDRETEAIFSEIPGIKTGAELRIVDDQAQPLISSLEDMTVTHTYSREWLEATTDFPSILNNFQHLFEFADRNVLLSLPAYRADLGVFERVMMMTGQTDYHFGAAYRVRDMTSTLQTQLATSFLESQDIELESVFAWFFNEYLVAEFGASGFSFRPSARGAGLLEKTRNLLVEMESVVRQFALHVEDGEIDRELLTIASDNIRYHQIPSLMRNRKYLYTGEAPEVAGVLHALFSDQSSMNYIDEGLQDEDLATLLMRNHVSREQFEEHQTSTLDQLISIGVLRDQGGRVQIGDAAQFMILRSVWVNEAASYIHLTKRGRAAADEMINQGWLRLVGGLLTSAEASYFNFQLNKVEFHNGPELRNKYLHGSQADEDGPRAHFATYITALKLTVALIIKINDDFLAAAQLKDTPRNEDQSSSSSSS